MIEVTLNPGPVTTKVYERLQKLVSLRLQQDTLDAAQAALLARQRERFLDQEDPDSVPWIVSQSSLRRAKSGRDGGTLFDTGNLFHSIQAYRSGDPEVRKIGTDVDYGVLHQFGLQGMVRRVFLGFNDEDQNVFHKIVVSKYAPVIKSVGGQIGAD